MGDILRLSPVSGLIAAVAGLLALNAAPTARAQTVTEFTLPNSVKASDITVGPDGALWFSGGLQGNSGVTGLVGRISTGGTITTFPTTVALSFATFVGITTGPDGDLWVGEGEIQANQGRAGKITTGGAFTDYTLTSANAEITAITAGPDGALWFTDLALNRVGKVTTDGKFTEYPTPQTNSSPDSITLGPDGNIWFIEQGNQNVSPKSAPKIGKITPGGVITEYPITTSGLTPFNSNGGITGPHTIIAGPDGALWFTETGANKIGRITTDGTITEFALPTANARPEGIAVGQDGALWYTEFGVGLIGRITTSGNTSEYTLPTTGSAPASIIQGPDGNLWFVETASSKIGKITLPANGSPLVSAVLPASRSVSVGATATAFATIINSGSSALSGCTIVPVTSIPATFSYQTTDPNTNAPTGTPNTPVSIAAGAAKSFFFAFTPQAAFVPVNVVLGYDCAGQDAASSSAGLNTLLLSGSSTPVPDLVALGATVSGDGVLHVKGSSAAAAFAVATVNVGADASSITATANTGSATLPINITICQTNPTTGACLSPPGPSVNAPINANATPTFGIFATATGTVPFSPGASRIFVQFSDSGGVVRGATSVAVTTTQ